MPNVLEKTGAAISSVLNGARKLINPDNLDSQISRGDLERPDSQPAVGRLSDFINLAEQRYQESRNGRWNHHAQFYEGIAYYCNNQGGEWNGTSGRMVRRQSRNPDLDEKFDPRRENIVRVMADRMTSRVTGAYPDAWAAPQTDSPQDKQAAQIQRAINAHCTRETRRQELLREAVLLMGISTTCFIETWWDSKAFADVGIPRPDGTVEYHRAQVGDVANSLVMAIDAYPDPNAAFSPHGIHGGAYFIKRETRSLSYIQDKWGKTVSATCESDTHGYLLQRLQWIAGDYTHQQAKIKNATEVTSMWEKPSEQYPEGRFLVYSADKTCLYAGEWPYKNEDGSPYAERYPFVAFSYAKNFGSVWALNFVADLIDIQIDLNDLATYLSGRMMWDRPVLFNPSNSQISPDDLTKHEYAQIINHKGEEMGGAKPTWMFPGSPGDFYFRQHDRLMAKAEFIAGVRDFNSDTASPIKSGRDYELRLAEDKSRLRPVIEHVSENVVELYEWDAALYRMYGAAFQRLLGLDDKATPAKDLQGPNVAASALVDIQALRNGNTRVVLQPGSGEAKLPAARQEELLEICQAMVNMPAPLVEFLLTQLQAIRSDADVDRFLAAYKEYEAQQQQQAQQVQAMKGDQAQQQLALKAQQANAEADAKIKADEAQAAIKVHATQITEAARATADQAIEQHRADAAANLEQLKFEHASALLSAEHAAPPKVSLTAKMGSVGVQSAEKMAGFPATDNPEEIKKMNVKPVAPKAPPTPKRKSDG